MKRKSLMFACATGVLLIAPFLIGGIIQTSNYYSNKTDKANLELVQYNKDTVNTKQYKNTYDFETLINNEKRRLIEEKKKIEIEVEISAYTNDPICVGEWSVYSGLTASGAYTQKGTLALPKELPFGTKLYMPDYKEYSRNNQGLFIGDDRGGYITKTSDGVYRIDMWVSTLEEAYKIGRVRTKAWIIKD